MIDKLKKQFFNWDFFLLWMGRCVSQLGDGAGFIAVMWWVQSETGSAVALGTLAMVRGLVSVMASPFAGVIVDHFDRKKIIILTDVLRGLIYIALSYLVFQGSLSLVVLYALSGLATLCTVFFGPSITASIPLLVPDEGLERANALNQVTRHIVRIAGYAAGGVMVAAVGIPLLLLIDGISFLLSAFSEAFIHIPRAHLSGVEGSERLSWSMFVADLKEGIAYLAERGGLFRLMRLSALLNFFYAPFYVLLPKFVDDILGAGSSAYGYLLSANMAGGLLATLIISTSLFFKDRIYLVKWGVVIETGFLLSFAYLPGRLWPLHLLLLLCSGFINAVVNVHVNTVLQRMTDQKYMGKVFGVLSTASGALQPAGQGLAGLAAELVSVPAIYTGCFLSSGGLGTRLATLPEFDEFLSGREQKGDEKHQKAVSTSSC